MPRQPTSFRIASTEVGLSRNCRLLLALLAVLLWIPSARGASASSAVRSGEAIFHEECARCHGPMGQGTKKTTEALAGEKSPSQLTKLIARTMPEDDPGTCTAEEYRRVAGFIYGAFYSPDAQARLHPPRVALSHLTVGQYRGTVADLIGSFRPAGKADSRQGLHGEYFNGKNIRNSPQIDRIDSRIAFDFGVLGPEGDGHGKSPAVKLDPDQFCIRWEGSVVAPETGDYEFVVRTDEAVRLWVNDPNTPAIEGIVKSGNDTEYRAPIFLIAGRSYPVRLEIYKGRGLSAKKKPVPTKESVTLLWKGPHGSADEIVPTRYLSPGRSPEVAVVRTPFPPDDRSFGWERGSSVSPEWVSATTEAALEVAGYVSARLPELAGAPEDAKDRNAKLKAFCRSFAQRAFRRPLSDAEVHEIVDRQFEGGADVGLAVKRVVIRVLISPEFLYPGVDFKADESLAKSADEYAVASRLALAMWDSEPDEKLLAAAAAGKLATREQVAAQALRMFDDPRARLKIRRALLAWLRVDQPTELVKDTKKFPGFDAALASDLRTSLEMTLDDVVSSDSSDFRQLLLSNELFLNGRLAKFYGIDLPADAGFTKVKAEPQRCGGVLTHPYMLANFAYPRESSPIHRGVFIIRGILGVTLRPPANSAFTPLAAELHPDLTTRQRVTLQTSPDACVACHSIINPLGFSLENFDAVGRWRGAENGKPIDASGEYETRAGPTAKFDGAKGLATFLAGNQETHDAFVQQLFQQIVKQPVRAYGLDEPARLRKSFADSGFSIRKLVVEIAVTAAQPR